MERLSFLPNMQGGGAPKEGEMAEETVEKTLEEVPEKTGYGRHVVQYSVDYSVCGGCHSCEIVCSFLHDGLNSPTHNRLFVDNGGSQDCIAKVYSCQHCDDHPCYESCPKKDKAMCIDENGIVYIDEEFCIGCGKCIKNCKFDPPRINMARGHKRKEWRAKKCDLCRGREEGPACVQYCPVRCIGIGTDPEGHVVDPEITDVITLNSVSEKEA